MGYSLRSKDWRYTAWLKFNTDTFLPSLNATPLAEELYSHGLQSGGTTDFEMSELVNEALNPLHRKTVKEFRKELFDFLYNSTHQHLFQWRASVDVKMDSIVRNRFHQSFPYHHLLPKGHVLAMGDD